MHRSKMLVATALVVIVTLGCSVGGGGGTGGTGGSSAAGGYNTKFPLPASVSNFTTSANGQVNFQTSMSLKDTIAFYRDALGKAGLTERTINTAITDTTFSMVFDGDPSGQAVVVQGVDLGNGTTNVNIRYEKV